MGKVEAYQEGNRILLGRLGGNGTSYDWVSKASVHRARGWAEGVVVLTIFLAESPSVALWVTQLSMVLNLFVSMSGSMIIL